MDYKKMIESTPVVLVEFYAAWCPHCQHMMPVVAKVKELLEGKVNVYQIDVDEYVNISEDEDVESYPTFIIYKNGKEVWRHVGEIDGDLLFDKVQKQAVEK